MRIQLKKHSCYQAFQRDSCSFDMDAQSDRIDPQCEQVAVLSMEQMTLPPSYATTSLCQQPTPNRHIQMFEAAHL